MSRDIYLRTDSVVSRFIAGETIVVPVRGNIGDLASIYRFNGTGSRVWEALVEPRSLEQLVCLVELEYDARRNSIEEDVTLFLEEMRSAGLVTVVEAAAARAGTHQTASSQA
jgi:hypothetical protein